MTLKSAATATGLALLFAGLYIAECAWWPFAKCWCCKGSGKHSREDGQVWRTCRWCKGSGDRLRVGRRIWNRFARVRASAR